MTLAARVLSIEHGFVGHDWIVCDKGDNRNKARIWPTACQAPTTGNGFSLNVQYVIGLGGEQLTELQANNNWSHTNVFGGGGLLATYSGSDTIYALTDWQGTKRGETSAAGCLGSWSSLPFGNDLTQAGNCVDASEHHYTGKVRDSETGYASGNDDFGARYYASSIGHWLSPDWAAAAEAVPYASYGSPQTLNLYAFVGNNPLSDADPDGHSSYGEQTMCSNGPSGGQCGVGTDPFATGSTGMGPEMGCDTEGGEHCTPNMQETSYNAWLGAAQKAQEAAQQPLSSVSVLGRTVGISYGKGLSLADELAASGKIGAAAGLINANADSLSASDKKAIGQISSFTVAGPGTYLGATGKGSMTLSAGYIEASSAAWVGSLFGHEGQHYLNAGKYSGANLWRDEQSAGRTQLGIGNKIGFGSSESRYLEQWIDDRNRNAMQQHMQQGYSY